MNDVDENGWQPNLDRTQADPEGFWMTRRLDGWQLHIRLISNNYKSAIDQLHVEPTETTALRGIRGHIELPSGNPRTPTWTRIPLPSARRQAAATLNAALTADRKRDKQEKTHDRREPAQRMTALLAGFRDFSPQATAPPKRRPRKSKDIELATIAAAYAAATQGDSPSHPREETLERLRAAGYHYAPSTIGPLIARARAAGMLTPTSPGKAAGKLTPKAKRILRNPAPPSGA